MLPWRIRPRIQEPPVEEVEVEHSTRAGVWRAVGYDLRFVIVFVFRWCRTGQVELERAAGDWPQ
jgi:hypothetical protein